MIAVTHASTYEAGVRELVGAVLRRSRGRLELAAFDEEVARGDRTLFASRDSVGRIRSICTAALLEYPSGLTVVDIDHASGTLEDLPLFLPVLVGLGRENGAHRLQLEGRKGWSRVLPGAWREYSRKIELDLGGACGR